MKYGIIGAFIKSAFAKMAFGYMLGYNDLKDPSVPGAFRLLAKVADGFMKMQIVKIEFREA
jgi:hypothetical protein